MAEKKKRTPDLEKSMRELENIVTALEDGELPLDKALAQFEQGVKLSRDCQQALEHAEQRVQVLLENDELGDFEQADGER